MAKYRIEIKKSAIKEIESLPPKMASVIVRAIGALADNPRPQGCQKLSTQERYRIRCGDYRIVYAIENDILMICVVKVGHRKEVYR